MSSITDATPSFGTLHFGEAQLGDIRRTRRLVQVADTIAQHPGGTLPQKFHDPAPLDAAYRMANRKEVTHAAVLEPHRQRTLRLMREAKGVILLIHDTTELDYTSIASLKKLGQIGTGGGRGYLCHNTLAVHASTRTVIGLANQILTFRDKVPKDESRQAKRNRVTRESRLWKQGSKAVGPAPEGSIWVDVCDRAADMFEFIEHKHKTLGHYIVRSQFDRRCTVWVDGNKCPRKLHEHARGLEPIGARYISVPARNGQPARLAKVAIATGAVEVVAPKQPRGEHGTDPLLLNIVIVREIDAPEGAEPLEWILLTNLAAADLAEACLIVDWYGYRWIVEELHKGMKTGCGIETLQFTTEEALEPFIALLSVVAVFLLSLRDAGRDLEKASQPATQHVPVIYTEVLCGWRHRELRPDWTVGEFYYALGRLGGHQNRRGTPPPGWIVLSRGWTRLQAMVEGAEVQSRYRNRAGGPGERPQAGPWPEAGTNCEVT